MNFSFAGCGFLGIYHVGVAACIKKYAPDLLVNKISGASAGALAAACLLCDAPLGYITSSVLKTATEARKRTLGPFSPTFNIEQLLRDGLLKVLPDNAHEIVNGRLFVSVTRVCDGKNVLISQFETREELVQSLLCSAYIPGFSGWIPLSIKGVRYIDGGFSDNLPVINEQTITVSPFMGESDICPRDCPTFMQISLANTSIELSRENLYRFAGILFPPHPKVLSRMCQQGFNDTCDFLQRSNLINCTRCLALSCTLNMKAGEEEYSNKKKRSTKKAKKNRISTDCEDADSSCGEENCTDCHRQREEAILDTLPEAVGSILQDSIDKANKGLMSWVFKNRSMKLVSILTLPYSVPVEIMYLAWKRFIQTVKSLTDLNGLASQLVSIIRALIKSWLTRGAPATVTTPHHVHRSRRDSAFSCHLNITEFAGDFEGGPISNKTNLDFNLDLDNAEAVILPSELDALSQIALNASMKTISRSVSRNVSRMASRVQSRAPSRAVSRAVSRRPSVDLDYVQPDQDWESSNVDAEITGDTFEQILEATRHQEALMAYYYMDENDEMKVTEIFDLPHNDDSVESGSDSIFQSSSENEDHATQFHHDDKMKLLHSRLQCVKDTIQLTVESPSSCSNSEAGSESEPEAERYHLEVPSYE